MLVLLQVLEVTEIELQHRENVRYACIFERPSAVECEDARRVLESGDERRAIIRCGRGFITGEDSKR